VTLLNLGGSLGEFGLEPSPCALVVVRVLLAEQPECFLCGQLGDASEITDSKPIQNLGALQFSCARA